MTNYTVNVLGPRKGEEHYVFVYRDELRDETLRMIRCFAIEPQLSFSWYDAAVLAKKIRETAKAVDSAADSLGSARPVVHADDPLPGRYLGFEYRSFGGDGMLSDEQKKFANDLIKNCESRDQWLSVMRFGMVQLLTDSSFVLRLIVERAARETLETRKSETVDVRQVGVEVAPGCFELPPGWAITPLSSLHKDGLVAIAVELAEQLGLQLMKDEFQYGT